jgi:hypothetical protein
MDEYLKPNASYERLLKEYRQYGSVVVAFDFDNTVYDFHHKGETYQQIIELLRELKELNCYLICFTANQDTTIIIDYLIKNKIPYDSINENPPFFICDARKIYFNVLLDDRAGLMQTYQELKQLISTIKEK